MQVLAPVIEEPCLAEVFRRAELLFQVVLEAHEDILVGCAVGGGLIVDLPADHVRIILVARHDLADQALGIEAVCRRIGIHVLAHAVGVLHAVELAGQDFRVLFGHPGRNGVGRGTHDDLDAGFSHGLDHAVHPGIFEAAVFRLPQAPGRFAQAHHVEAGRLHHLHVLFQPLIRHVLMVVGGAVQDGRHGRRHRLRGRLAVSACGQGARQRRGHDSLFDHCSGFLMFFQCPL
jgi:hypothetical protein